VPARPLNPGVPAIYLDWSTFVQAFNAASLTGAARLPGLAGLLSLVEEMAAQANLIFSHIHLSELAAWEDLHAAQGMAAWLDGLPLVWARLWPHVQESEDDFWVRKLAGCESTVPVRVFAPSMLATLESLSVARSPDVLQHTLASVFVEERRDGTIAASMAADARAWAETMHWNRQSPNGAAFTPEAIARFEEDVAWRHRTELRHRACAAHRRLLNSALDYATLNPSLDDVVDPFVTMFQQDPAALPLTKVFAELSQGFIATSVARSPDSRRFEQLGSSMADIFHALIGAAYCPVFTCDRLTASWLGDVRTGFGFGAPVVFAGDGANFVGELRSAWESSELALSGG
jgi:hypothetical protein